MRLLAISSTVPAPIRAGDTEMSRGVIAALSVIGAGARSRLANSSSPQPEAASARASPSAVHDRLRSACSVLTEDPQPAELSGPVNDAGFVDQSSVGGWASSARAVSSSRSVACSWSHSDASAAS